MDALVAFLAELKRLGLVEQTLLGLLHILIGRTLRRTDGTVISSGVTWRELAGVLKKARWPKDTVTEIGLNPDDLPPRDRQQYWYVAIARAHVDSAAAVEAGNRLAEQLRTHGYEVGPAPGR